MDYVGSRRACTQTADARGQTGQNAAGGTRHAAPHGLSPASLRRRGQGPGRASAGGDPTHFRAVRTPDHDRRGPPLLCPSWDPAPVSALPPALPRVGGIAPPPTAPPAPLPPPP